MSAEQEREELIELARQAIDPDRPESYDPAMIAERIVNADWRPPPSGDVVEQAAQVVYLQDPNADIDHGEMRVVAWSDAPEWATDHCRMVARALAAAGLLRAPVGQDEAEALGEYVSIPVPPDAETVERVAQALHVQDSGGFEWAAMSLSYRATYRERAAAVLSALGEATDG